MGEPERTSNLPTSRTVCDLYFIVHFIFHIANYLLCIIYRVFLFYPRPAAHFLHVYLSYFTNPASWLPHWNKRLSCCMYASCWLVSSVLLLHAMSSQATPSYWCWSLASDCRSVCRWPFRWWHSKAQRRARRPLPLDLHCSTMSELTTEQVLVRAPESLDLPQSLQEVTHCRSLRQSTLTLMATLNCSQPLLANRPHQTTPSDTVQFCNCPLTARWNVSNNHDPYLP